MPQGGAFDGDLVATLLDLLLAMRDEVRALAGELDGGIAEAGEGLLADIGGGGTLGHGDRRNRCHHNGCTDQKYTSHIIISPTLKISVIRL
jgi:hypothetical protein